MTRRRHRASAGTDRWMISWADLLTLLFASLVVLYASAARNGFPGPKGTRPPVAKPVSQPVTQPVMPPVARAESQAAGQSADELDASFDRLRKSLAREIDHGHLQVSLETRGIVVSLKDQAYFKSGSDEIAPAALEGVSEVASVIRELPNSVRLEGHSDSVPIHNDKFRDNWSLSAARSAAVLSLLESSYGIPPARLAIAAYADNQPVAANESEEGRARNRRVDIVILHERGQ